MSVILNTDVDSDLFVTTTDIINGTDTTQSGEHYTLSDYESKTDFLKELKEDFAIRGNHNTPTFVFQDHPITFTPINLVGEHDLDAQIWDFLALEDEDQIYMTVAYAAKFGMVNGSSEKTSVQATLEAAAERSYGKHDNDTDFAYSELDAQGIMEKLPPIIEANIDIDNIAIQLLRINNIAISETPCGNFYFRDY